MGFGLTFVLSIDIGWILVFRTDFKSLFLPCKGFCLTFVSSVLSPIRPRKYSFALMLALPLVPAADFIVVSPTPSTSS